MYSKILSGLAVALLLLGRGGPGTLAQGTGVLIPDPGLNEAVRAALQVPTGPITPEDMLRLTNLFGTFRRIQNLEGIGAARNLRTLFLDDNDITNFPAAELANLNQLEVLDLSENRATELSVPPGLTNLSILRVEVGRLTSLTLPTGLVRLTKLQLGANQLTNLVLPSDMTNLKVLSAYNNHLTNLILPIALTNLTDIVLEANQLSEFSLPAGLTKLSALVVSANRLTHFTLAADATNLAFLRLNDNQLTNVVLPAGLNQLGLVMLADNRLRSVSLPSGLTNLTMLNVSENHLAELSFPPDVRQLSALFLTENPLTRLIVSEPLAATGLASVVDSLRTQGVTIFTYPLTPEVIRPLILPGAFKIGITGPPGIYSVFASTNLSDWTGAGAATNTEGDVNFVHVSTNVAGEKFYRVALQPPASNMVFVAPQTFTMGSPTNDFDRSIFEGPQAEVTLTRAFWIGKYEVTQGEYAAIMGENPSEFPGDLNRPVSSVDWTRATDYCARLTQRERAAGRISPGTSYRLPTEAEWECAARGGSTTQFSYGDDPDYSSLTHFGWFLDLGNVILTVRPVGQKLPNAWGLYDVHGNVWEWCQDWYGEQTGGVKIDPVGPASNTQGAKVIRGGAYDYPNSSCRSASRLFRNLNLPDTDVGFRVVLAAAEER